MLGRTDILTELSEIRSPILCGQFGELLNIKRDHSVSVNNSYRLFVLNVTRFPLYY